MPDRRDHHPRNAHSPRLEAAYAALGEHRADAGDRVGAFDGFERAARTPGRWAAYVAAQHDGRAASDFDVALTLAARAGVFVPAELTRALLTERAAVLALSACP